MAMNVFGIAASAWQILYTSYDPMNKVQFATPATLLVPSNSNHSNRPADMKPVLVYSLAYDSASKLCGPSYQASNKSLGLSDAGEMAFVQLALLQGITVVLPDYEGPNGAFTVGPIEGNGVLDALRATLSFKPVVPDRTKAKVVLKGYSGGSIATGWALQQQPSHAPELLPYIAGASLGGIPRDLKATLQFLNGGPFSGLVLSAFAAYDNVFAPISSFFDTILNLPGLSALRNTQTLCTTEEQAQYSSIDIFKQFTTLTFTEVIGSPLISPLLTDLTLANPQGSAPFSVPQVPIFVYSSQTDNVVPHSGTQEYVDVLCQNNVASVSYANVLNGDHVHTEELIGPRQSWDFLSQRLFDPAPAPTGCVTSVIDPAQQPNITITDIIRGIQSLF